jgi:hypothetical protein
MVQITRVGGVKFCPRLVFYQLLLAGLVLSVLVNTKVLVVEVGFLSLAPKFGIGFLVPT